MFLPGKEEFHPQASGSVVKAPAVQEKEQSQNEENQEDAEEKFESILPGRKWWRGKIGQQQKSYIFFNFVGLTTTPLEPHAHYSAEELSMAVATSCVCALVVGFITGFLMSRRCSCSPRDDDNPYHVPYLNQLVEPFWKKKHQLQLFFSKFASLFRDNCDTLFH